MKKILIVILCLFISSVIYSQFSLQPRLGVNIEKYLIGGMDIAYEIYNFHFSGGLIMDKYEDAFFGLRIGYYIGNKDGIRVMPMVSRSFKYVSADKTEFTKGNNYWVWDYGIRLEKDIYFIQVNKPEEFQFTIGAKIR